jgi:hypothetical protein
MKSDNQGNQTWDLTLRHDRSTACMNESTWQAKLFNLVKTLLYVALSGSFIGGLTHKGEVLSGLGYSYLPGSVRNAFSK